MNIWHSGARQLVLAALLLQAGAVIAGPVQGNLPAGAYPEPACGERPRAPVRPEQFTSDDEVAKYNSAVREFNAENRKHYDCIQRYVDGAAEDIRAIRARVRAVIDKANRADGGG